MPGLGISVARPLSMPMTDEPFFDFCQVNRDLRIERDRPGVISILFPAGSEGGHREGPMIAQLYNWSDADGTGIAFSSGAGFKLSTGAERSPDASWMGLDRWNQLTAEQKTHFAPICPDFVLELRSESDRLKPLQQKMEEYLAEPGCRLGFLIDRKDQQVFIYRPNQGVECLAAPETVSAEPELSGFVLNLSRVW